MATFRDREKERYKELKRKLFSNEAQPAGNYRGRSRFFCLGDEHSFENLYVGIRKPAIQYFKARKITWHDGLEKRRVPSNHLCCSQSCCINFLYPMTTKPRVLASVFQHFYPELVEPLRIDEDLPLPNGSFPYMAFEWIGVCDYLGETKRKGSERTRGANFTSADFIFRFRRKDRKIQIVLGEWKYTEEYGRDYKGSGRSGEVRKNNYINFFNDQSGTFSAIDDREKLYDSLFYEPFYQLMRLQLLAQEMETHEEKEMDADIVSVLHICPEANYEFRKNVASDYLKGESPKKGVLEIWKELVPEDKFLSISVEDLLDTIVRQVRSGNQEWVDYLGTRYGWKAFIK